MLIRQLFDTYNFYVTVNLYAWLFQRLVIKTKSVEYMPFALSFFLTLCAIMWFFYGFLINDFYIAVSSQTLITLSFFYMIKLEYIIFFITHSLFFFFFPLYFWALSDAEYSRVYLWSCANGVVPYLQQENSSFTGN